MNKAIKGLLITVPIAAVVIYILSLIDYAYWVHVGTILFILIIILMVYETMSISNNKTAE